MLVQQSFEECDGGEKIVAECAEQVDIVEISVAGEAVGEVVAGVHGGEQFAAARAEEDEASVAEFRGRPIAAEGSDGGGHRQVVADAPQQLGVSSSIPQMRADFRVEVFYSGDKKF